MLLRLEGDKLSAELWQTDLARTFVALHLRELLNIAFVATFELAGTLHDKSALFFKFRKVSKGKFLN